MAEKQKKDWQKDEIIQLIEEIHLYPELWDIRNRGFQNKRITNTTVDLIATKFLTTTEEVVKKWQSLRSRFNQIVKKQAKQMSLTGNFAPSTWPYYSSLKFLEKENDPLLYNNNELEVETLDESTGDIGFIPTVASVNIPVRKSERISTKAEVQPTYYFEDSSPEYIQEPPAKKVRKVKQEIYYSEPRPLPSAVMPAPLPPAPQPAPQPALQPALQPVMQPVLPPIDDNKIFGDFVSQQLRMIKCGNLKRHLCVKIQRDIVDVMECELSIRVNPYNTGVVIDLDKTNNLIPDVTPNVIQPINIARLKMEKNIQSSEQPAP